MSELEMVSDEQGMTETPRGLFPRLHVNGISAVISVYCGRRPI